MVAFFEPSRKILGGPALIPSPSPSSFLLFSSFNSLRYASLIMLNLPFAMIGGIFVLWISGGVQRPLAIVVIGGFVTSTLLTLLVLPSIFPWFEPKKKKPKQEQQEKQTEPGGPATRHGGALSSSSLEREGRVDTGGGRPIRQRVLRRRSGRWRIGVCLLTEWR